MNDKLIPCPFCGKELTEVYEMIADVDTSYHVCKTKNCFWDGRAGSIIEQRYYNRFNHRPREDSLIAALEDCKETISYAQQYFDKSLSAYDDCKNSLQLIEEAIKKAGGK